MSRITTLCLTVGVGGELILDERISIKHVGQEYRSAARLLVSSFHERNENTWIDTISVPLPLEGVLNLDDETTIRNIGRSGRGVKLLIKAPESINIRRTDVKSTPTNADKS